MNLSPPKKPSKSPTIPSQLLGFDLGNTYLMVAHSKSKSITLLTTLLIENSNVYLNKKATPEVFSDVLAIAGQKYEDKAFRERMKYHNLEFQKGNNQNVAIFRKEKHKSEQNKLQTEEIYVELLLSLLIKGVFATNPVLNFLSSKPLSLVVTIFEGKLNPYRLSLKQSLLLSQFSQPFFFTNTSICLAVNCLLSSSKTLQLQDTTQMLMVIDFGAQGLTCSVYKLYYDVGIVETIKCQVSQLGGVHMTQLLVDFICNKLVKEKGMDISKNSFLMHRLKLLCDQAKHTLSSTEKAFIRLDNLPNILVFGCQVTIQQFQECITSQITYNVKMISQILVSLKEDDLKIDRIILNGGSCRIPLFRKMLKDTINKDIPLTQCEGDEIKYGLLALRSQQIKIVDICAFDIRLQGDEQNAAHLVPKGQHVPFRACLKLTFPSGQLTFSLRIYQNKHLIATCFVPQRPRQNTFNFYLEVDHNKMVNIFATTSKGLIKMNVNYISIGRQQIQKCKKFVQKSDFIVQED